MQDSKLILREKSFFGKRIRQLNLSVRVWVFFFFQKMLFFEKCQCLGLVEEKLSWNAEFSKVSERKIILEVVSSLHCPT